MDDDAPASEGSRRLLLCPLELAVSCDVSDISLANNLCLKWSKGQMFLEESKIVIIAIFIATPGYPTQLFCLLLSMH